MQCIDEIQKIHENGLLHRDIKVENFMYDEKTKKITVIDFGMLQKIGEPFKKVEGTPGYIAPEILQDKQYSTGSDMYALGRTIQDICGIVAYDILTIDGKKGRFDYGNMNPDATKATQQVKQKSLYNDLYNLTKQMVDTNTNTRISLDDAKKNLLGLREKYNLPIKLNREQKEARQDLAMKELIKANFDKLVEQCRDLFANAEKLQDQDNMQGGAFLNSLFILNQTSAGILAAVKMTEPDDRSSFYKNLFDELYKRDVLEKPSDSTMAFFASYQTQIQETMMGSDPNLTAELSKLGAVNNIPKPPGWDNGDILTVRFTELSQTLGNIIPAIRQNYEEFSPPTATEEAKPSVRHALFEHLANGEPFENRLKNVISLDKKNEYNDALEQAGQAKNSNEMIAALKKANEIAQTAYDMVKAHDSSDELGWKKISEATKQTLAQHTKPPMQPAVKMDPPKLDTSLINLGKNPSKQADPFMASKNLLDEITTNVHSIIHERSAQAWKAYTLLENIRSQFGKDGINGEVIPNLHKVIAIASDKAGKSKSEKDWAPIKKELEKLVTQLHNDLTTSLNKDIKKSVTSPAKPQAVSLTEELKNKQEFNNKFETAKEELTKLENNFNAKSSDPNTPLNEKIAISVKLCEKAQAIADLCTKNEKFYQFNESYANRYANLAKNYKNQISDLFKEELKDRIPSALKDNFVINPVSNGIEVHCSKDTLNIFLSSYDKVDSKDFRDKLTELKNFMKNAKSMDDGYVKLPKEIIEKLFNLPGEYSKTNTIANGKEQAKSEISIEKYSGVNSLPNVKLQEQQEKICSSSIRLGGDSSAAA